MPYVPDVGSPGVRRRDRQGNRVDLKLQIVPSTNETGRERPSEGVAHGEPYNETGADEPTASDSCRRTTTGKRTRDPTPTSCVLSHGA